MNRILIDGQCYEIVPVASETRVPIVCQENVYFVSNQRDFDINAKALVDMLRAEGWIKETKEILPDGTIVYRSTLNIIKEC